MAAPARQLDLYEHDMPEPRRQRHVSERVVRPVAPMCAGCRAMEARYGFRDEEGLDRPRTLCFECFRMEIVRRQTIAARLARSWNAEQVELPLSDTLYQMDVRRRRAQIAARRALGIR